MLKEISHPLLSDALFCGQTACRNIELTQYTATQTYTDRTYTHADFVTPDIAGLAKRARILPYYEETYSLKKDILKELKR